jgi:NADH-quinone oxidoreductase subunit C
MSDAQPQTKAPPAPPPRPPTPPAAAPPKPEPVRAKELSAKVTAAFPDVKVEWMKESRLKLSAPPSKIAEVGTLLRDSHGFDHISTVSGVDWIAKNELEVVYFVNSVSKAGWEDFVVALSERVPRDSPSVPTLIGVWPGARYHEQETHEMFGINFEGHPSTAHVLLPEDWNDMPPLRKDYVSPGR